MLSKVLNRISVGRAVHSQAVVLTALVAGVLTLVSISFSVWQSGMVAREGVRNLVQIAATNTSGYLAPHMRFGNVEAVLAELDQHALTGGESFVSIVAWNAAGEVMASVGEAEVADLESLRTEVMESAEVLTSGNGFTVIAPVIFDEGQGAIGAIATTWTPRPALARIAMQTAIVSAILIGLFVALSVFASRRLKSAIGAPMGLVEGAVGRVAAGNYDEAVAMQDRRDEIGSISRAVEALRQKLQSAQKAMEEREEGRKQQEQVVERLGRALQALAQGDLTERINADLGGEYDSLRKDFNSALAQLSEAMLEIGKTVVSIQQGSNAISLGSDDLAARTEEQAATLQQTSSAISQLNGSVQVASDSAQEVENRMHRASETALASRDVVHNAQDAMAAIQTSSQQVSQIVGMIDEIAFQTNLLALNAGVEAARAGDAGRGFAVVASEVRELAQRASGAAGEIRSLIERSNDQVQTGVTLVERAGEALGQIADQVATVSERVTDIASGSVEQANGLGEITTAIGSLDQVTQRNAAMVEETNAAAHALNDDTARMAELMSRFRLEGQTENIETRSVA